MSKPVIKYVGMYHGCTLRTGSDASIIRALGEENITTIRPATQDDIVHFKWMGGHIPEGRIVPEVEDGRE